MYTSRIEQRCETRAAQSTWRRLGAMTIPAQPPRRFERVAGPIAGLAMLLLMAACGGGGSGSDGGSAATYTVSGTVTGWRGSGAALMLRNNGNDDAPDIFGKFSFKTALPSGGTYSVTVVAQPDDPVQTCTVTNGSGTIANANISNVLVDCPFPTAYAVGGTITGLTGKNLTLLYSGDNLKHSPSLQTSGDGSAVTFAMPADVTSALPGTHYSYSVFAQPTSPDQNCVITNGSGTVANADVTSVQVTCLPLLAVGGTVTGLVGKNLELGYSADNTSATPSVAVNADGAFVFPTTSTRAVSGTHYNVVVKTQPTGPDQVCGVSGGSGTVGNTAVNGVKVTCTPVSVPSSCAPQTGAGTLHGSVNAAETWTEAASPHTLRFDISVSAPITIEPCAVVRIPAGVTVTVNPSGAFIAAGALGRPVTIEALVPGAAWASIRNLGGSLSLSHAIVSGGGARLSFGPAYTGVLRMQSNGALGTLHVDDVEITDSLTQGVYINGEVGFDATSQNLRVHGAAGYPVHVYARVIGSIPTGTYTGNGIDAIAIAGSGGAVVDAQTMHDRGVPYHVGSGADGGRMDVSTQLNGPAAVLTIEPGVTMQFPPGGTLNIGTVGGPGTLLAIGGTGAQQIVFTSDQGLAAQAGDWLGIVFNDPVEAQSVMQNARVEFAGGVTVSNNGSCPYPGRTGVNYAAIRIFGGPLSQFITDTTIFASLRDGIDRGWRADLQPDFLASNTFTAVAGCKQSMPRTANGVCPATPACP